MADSFLKLLRTRRTCYNIEAKSPISDARIHHIAGEVIQHTPSSMNCQSTRYVILLRDEHAKFWTIAKECFRGTLCEAEYEQYEKKLRGRQAGYGTVSEILGFGSLNRSPCVLACRTEALIDPAVRRS